MLAMIITCPHCTTRYSVAATAFGAAARTVRCSNCNHLWVVQPPQLDQRESRPAKQRAVQVAAASPRRQTALYRAARSFQQDQKQDSDGSQKTAQARRTPPERPAEKAIGRTPESTNGPNIRLDKQPDAQRELPVGAPALGERAPPAPPSPPPPRTSTSDDAAGAAPHDGASGGSAARSDARPDRFPVATEEAAAANVSQESPQELTPELEDKPARKPAPGWRRRAIFAALAVTVLVVGLGILLIGRDVIVAAISELPALVGLQEPLGAGLDIGAVTSFREETGDGDVLIVEGTVTNVTDDVRPLPVVRVALFDNDDAELQHVMVVPDQQVLAPGERIAFSARLEQPAPTARRIKVGFAARPEPT